MRHLYYIAILLLVFTDSCSQGVISKNKAINIAIENGIKQPLDSFEVVLKNDTLWEVHSLYCDDYYDTKTEIFSIDPVSGRKLNLLKVSHSLKWHSNPRPRTEINHDFVDSLLEVNRKLPVKLLPDYFEYEANPKISPNSKWIAFNCGFGAIAISSIDGKEYRKICDSCLYPQWTEKDNTLIYEKSYGRFYRHNIETDEISQLTDNESRYLYFSFCPKGKWISYVKSIPRKSDNPNITVGSFEGEDYELYVKSIPDGIEKRITYDGEVHNPIWNRTGDTIFFYLNRKPYFATNFDFDKPIYGIANNLEKISIWDYTSIVDNKFVYKYDCQLILINVLTLKPEKYILKDRDRYESIELSADGKLTVYTIKKLDKEKLYLIEN